VFPYICTITFSCDYVLNIFLLYVVTKCKHIWKTMTIFQITTVNFHSRSKVHIRLPNNSDMVWDRYGAPFSYGLWLAIAIATSAISVCLALTNYGHEKDQSLTVSTILFYIHACVCQQGQNNKSRYVTYVISILYYCYPMVYFHFSLSWRSILLFLFFVSSILLNPWTAFNLPNLFCNWSFSYPIILSLFHSKMKITQSPLLGTKTKRILARS
jgi:hypothetical protein